MRFYSEFPNGLKLNMRFKLAEMIYDGAAGEPWPAGPSVPSAGSAAAGG